MSNWHALRMTPEEHEIDIVFHITVPDETNSAGINLRDAVKQYLEAGYDDGIIKSDVPWITTELTQIQAGEIYEHRKIIEFNANLTLPEKRTIIDSQWTAFSLSIPNKIRSELKFWGMDRNVP